MYLPPEEESRVKQLLRDLTIVPGDGPSGHSIRSSIAFEALLLNCSKKLSICVSILVGELAIVTTETPKTNTTPSFDYDILQINSKYFSRQISYKFTKIAIFHHYKALVVLNAV